MLNVQNWDKTQEKFQKWWKQENTGRPLMYISAKKNNVQPMPSLKDFFGTPQELYFNVEKRCAWYEEYLRTHTLLAEAFPNINLDYGSTSTALYVGSQPECHWDTLWYKHLCEKEWETFEKKDLHEENPWLSEHYALLKRGKQIASDNYIATIPDIGCSLDVMSLLRGSENLIYDLIDEPERMGEISEKLTDLYLEVYDKCYEIVKEDDGSSAFVAFKVWGPGKVAKLECDFCALMNTELFERYALPALRKQAKHMDNAFYHLDGPDAIKHLDLLLKIPEIKAIQWTHGAGNPDGLWEGWYEKIYDRVIASGKSLYLFIEDADSETLIQGVQKLVDRYGSNALFLRFLTEMSEDKAQAVLNAFQE